ncbi:MAG: C-GCAxxG-C-C family protein [Muribaculaceae bacterium]|nr:C-GCAxxG-C-C family protein [Muribaculaceae bacterium]
MTLQQRLEKAADLRSKGYNCAQSVLMVFDDKTGLSPSEAARLCSALGSGAGCGELCGVPNAMAIAVGYTFSDNPADKVHAMKTARQLIDIFASGNKGRLRCADLKGKEGIRPCNDLIAQGIEILHNHFGDC